MHLSWLTISPLRQDLVHYINPNSSNISLPLSITIEISPVLRDYNNCYIMLLNSPQALENTGFVAGELSLIVSLVLYRPTSVYEL